ncbi:MAG: hypothetical protein V1739_02185 [Candidatus Omnitrophota bacterium]
MNKKIIFFAVFGVLLFGGNIFAAYVGGPLKTVGQGKWDFTIASNSAGDRDLVSPASTNAAITGVVEERNSLAGKVTYGIFNELDVYFKFGSSELEVDTRWPDGSRTKLKYDEANLFGGGVKYIYTFENDVLIGGDFQFALQQGNEVREITEGSIKAVITKKGEADLDEYQLSFFCGKKYKVADNITLIPYTGILFNGVDFSSDQLEYNTWPWYYTITPFELEQDDNFGLLIGGDIAINDRLFLSLEARFIADEAISGSLSYRF